VLYCVLKLCTVISTLRWAVLTVLWIGFCLTGPISLYVDLFVFICVYFVCFCFILHSCCIIVSAVGWTWWDWSLTLWTYLPSVLWHCWLDHLIHKILSPICPIISLVVLEAWSWPWWYLFCVTQHFAHTQHNKLTELHSIVAFSWLRMLFLGLFMVSLSGLLF